MNKFKKDTTDESENDDDCYLLLLTYMASFLIPSLPLPPISLSSIEAPLLLPLLPLLLLDP